MPRKPRPIAESWQHTLSGRAFLDAFFDCASAALALGIVPAGATEQVTLSLPFEELTGTLEEVRGHLSPEDVDALESATLRLSSRQAASAQRGSLQLSASAARGTVSLEVQHPPVLQVALELLATVQSKFPRDVKPPAAPAAPAAGAEQGAAAGARLAPGVQVDHYRLIRRLGTGYSGEVWQAEVVSTPPGVDLAPGQIVAMKQYFPSVLTKSSDSLRIQREFRVASEVRHENLVLVYDLVLSPSRRFGSFLVMEYVAGDTLKSRIPPGGFDWQRCVTIGRQLAAALAELHRYGALHRDIKPANIVVLPGDTWSIKLLDLGIVTLLGEEGLTEASVLLGSKHTSAPEQLFGEDIDERADLYALGATLYHCYWGRPLYDEEGPVTAVVRAMIEKPRPCLPKSGAGPAEVEFVRLLERCLSRDPAARPPTAQSCAEALAQF